MCSPSHLIRTSLHLLLALMVCACSTITQFPQPGNEIDRLGLSLKAILPAGWEITTQGNILKLTRSSKLWVYNRMQQDVRLSLDEWVNRVGVEVTYSITLRFEPLISREHYNQLKSERAPYEKIVNEGGGDMHEWDLAVNEFNKRSLPVYFSDRYSIYAEKPDVFPEQVYPESAAFECKQVVSSLDRLLQRYEPFSGKNSDFQVRI
jgi:hypothetical protein